MRPLCQFYEPPSDADREAFGITDGDVVFGCQEEQGEGPLYFLVPVLLGGAVRVGVCPRHAEVLERLYGKPS